MPANTPPTVTEAEVEGFASESEWQKCRDAWENWGTPRRLYDLQEEREIFFAGYLAALAQARAEGAEDRARIDALEEIGRENAERPGFVLKAEPRWRIWVGDYCPLQINLSDSVNRPDWPHATLRAAIDQMRKEEDA